MLIHDDYSFEFMNEKEVEEFIFESSAIEELYYSKRMWKEKGGLMYAMLRLDDGKEDSENENE